MVVFSNAEPSSSRLATPLLLICLSPPRLSGQAGVAWLGAVALDRCVARERTTQRMTPSGPGLDNTDHSLSVARLSKRISVKTGKARTCYSAPNFCSLRQPARCLSGVNLVARSWFEGPLRLSDPHGCRTPWELAHECIAPAATVVCPPLINPSRDRAAGNFRARTHGDLDDDASLSRSVGQHNRHSPGSVAPGTRVCRSQFRNPVLPGRLLAPKRPTRRHQQSCR